MPELETSAGQDFQPALGNPEVNAAFEAVAAAVDTFIQLSAISPDGVTPMIEDALYKQLSQIVTLANDFVNPSMFIFSSPSSEPITDLFIKNARISCLIICVANEAFRQCTASHIESSKNTQADKSQISKLKSLLEASEQHVLSLQERLAQVENQLKSALFLLQEDQTKYHEAIKAEKSTAEELRNKLESIQENLNKKNADSTGKGNNRSLSQQPTQKMPDNLPAEVRKLKKKNSQDKQALEALQKQVKILTDENADLKRQNKALREKLTASNQAHEKASAAATQALAEKDEKIAVLQAELDQVRQQMTEIKAGRNQDRETFSQQLADQATQAHRIAELQTAYADLQRVNAQLTAQSQGLLTANGSLYEANGHLVAQVQQMQGYIAHLQQYLYEQQGPAIPLGYAQPQPDARFVYSANTMGLFFEAGGPAGRGNAQAGQHVPTQHANR
jgi:chromosome segregation ATPase